MSEDTSGPDAVRLARVEASLTHMREDLAAIRQMLLGQGESYLSRREWMQRNAQVDDRTAGLGREIGQLREELAARRHPWPTVLSAIVSLAALGLVLIDRVTL